MEWRGRATAVTSAPQNRFRRFTQRMVNTWLRLRLPAPVYRGAACRTAACFAGRRKGAFLIRTGRWRPSVSHDAGATQIEGQREVGATLLGGHVESARRVAMVLEARKTPCFRLEAIDRKGLVVTAAGMRDMIDAAAERAAVPAIDEIEGQGGMDRNCRMQAGGGFPGLEAHSGNRFARSPGRGQGDAAPVARDDVAALHQSGCLYLQTLQRGIDIAHGSARSPLLAHHMPGLERLPHFEIDAAMLDGAVKGETEFKLRFEPSGIERIDRH